MAPVKNRYSMFTFFLVGALFLFLAPVFWLNTELPRNQQLGRGYENIDLYHWTYPVFHYGFERLGNGELPLWNSRQLCGTPFLANPATGIFQPLNAVFLFLSTQRAMAVQAFLGLFLAGFFFVLFARALDVGYLPAIIGGLVYAFRGASAAAMSRPELMAALAWTPLVLWAVREYARECRPAVAVLGGIGTAMLLLSGSYAMVLGTVLLAIPYAVLCTFWGGGSADSTWFRRGIGYLGMALLALLLSAVQWAPALAWMLHLDTPSALLGQLDLAGRNPAGLPEITRQLLFSEPDVLPHLGYMGVAMLIFAPAAFLYRPGRVEALFFGAGAVVLFPLAILGFSWVPGAFPVQALIFPATCCVVALGTLGAGRLFGVGRDIRSPLEWAPPLLVLIFSIALFYIGTASVRGRMIPLMAVLLPFLVVRIRWMAVVSSALVAMLVFVDLYGASTNYFQHPYRDAREVFEVRTELMKTAEEQSLGGRVLVKAHPLEKGISPNIGLLSPILAAGGFQFPLTREQRRWWDALRDPEATAPGNTQDADPRAASPALLNYLSARVLLMASDAQPDVEAWAKAGVRLRPIRKENGFDLYINDTARPRAFWTPQWKPVFDIDSAIALLADSAFDGVRECVVQVDEDGGRYLSAIAPQTNAAAEMPAPPVCTVEEIRPEHVVVRVDAPQAGVTILTDSFAPGWRATLDGTKVPIFRVNGLFRGIATTAGPHVIEFHYRPYSAWIGLALSILGLAVLALSALRGMLRRI